MKNVTTKVIARIGIILALIIAVELIEGMFLNMPQGGSISLSSLVFLFSMFFFSFGEVSIIFVLWRLVIFIVSPPYYVTLVQLFLDYIASYGVFLCMYPLVKQEKLQPFLLAVFVANVLRYFIHVATGMIYFAEYADGAPVLQYSLTYNATYMGPTLIVQLILALAGFRTMLSLKNKMK